MTPGIVALSDEIGADIIDCLLRHSRCDWGESSAEDKRENDLAVKKGDLRVFSVYRIGEHRIWIITEADRSMTTILTPEEY